MKYNIKTDINPHIYRGYDIRAIYGKDLDEDGVYTIGLGYGTYIKNNGYTKCVIGHDNRASSVPLSDALVAGITETGIDVEFLGLVTTPMYYLAQTVSYDIENKKTELMPGIMVTASHNPKEYNGLKFTLNDFGNACGEMIQEFRRFVEKGEFAKGEGKVTNKDIKPAYLDLIKKSIDLGDRKIKAVIDAGNGTASIIIEEIFDMLGIEYVPIFCDSDPDFPNHHPDPSEEENNEFLKQAVLKQGADLGIGIDGDGDRVGIIDEKGTMIYIDFYAIIIWRNLINSFSNKHALFDVKCSKSLSDEIEKLGGVPVCYRTGNSYVKAKMRDGKFDFGSELSGHVWFFDKWPNIDDGIYAGLRLVEILSKTDKSLSELLEGINKYYSTPEIKIPMDDSKKFSVIDEIEKYCVSKGYKMITIDGVRAEFSDGWALVRASNTSPNITVRFEAKSNERLEEIKKEFMDLLK